MTPVAVVSLAVFVSACASPAYPPDGRSSFTTAPARTEISAPAATSVSAPATTSVSAPAATSRTTPSAVARPVSPSYDVGSTLNTRKERWWPGWSDPANWFLEDQYQL